MNTNNQGLETSRRSALPTIDGLPWHLSGPRIKELEAEVERLRRFPLALQQIQEERQPGCIVPKSWYWLLNLYERIFELVEAEGEISDATV